MSLVKHWMMIDLKTILIIIAIFEICEGGIWDTDRNENQCESAIEETILADRATIVDETATRLQSTWLSQECEVRAGPEYVIRKYTFFENGTFLLLRHHYAEESCSVAMYTVSARGAIRLLTTSNHAPGATEARYQLDRVHIVPLTRQVAQKFSHRVNVSCTLQPRWRPYVAQLIYELPSRRNSNFLWEGPKYNTFQRQNPTAKTHRGLDCLEALGIEFGELRLVRVQTRPSTSRALALGSNDKPTVQLLLGSLPPNVYSKKTHRSTSLQSTALLRFDTIRGCLICGTIVRGTENSPPLLHEEAALPALLGGSWLSSSCESREGGLWMKRRLEIYGGDMLWTGRWDYYGDGRCTIFLYSVTAAGSYIQRVGRQRRHGESSVEQRNNVLVETFLDPSSISDYNSQVEETEKRTKRFASTTKRNLVDERETSKENSNQKNSLTSEENLPRIEKPVAELMTTEIPEAIKAKNKKNDGFFKKLGYLTKNNENDDKINVRLVADEEITERHRRSLDAESYRHLLLNAKPSMADAFAAMLRGNQRREETTKKPPVSSIPAGTTELDLHVAESVLVAGDLAIAARCGAHIIGDERELGSRGLHVRPLNIWPRSCVQHAIEAPSTLGLRARVGVNWSGQYTLDLGPRDDHLWDAPLIQCGPTASHNPSLRAHLRRSVGLRYGLYTSDASISRWNSSIVALCIILYFIRVQ